MVFSRKREKESLESPRLDVLEAIFASGLGLLKARLRRPQRGEAKPRP
jgi:hypothetical protein